MKRWHKGLTGVGVFVLLLAGFTAFILPGIVKERAIRTVGEATGRTLAIGGISINPFTWTAEVRGVRLTERDGATPFVSFSSVRVAVSPASVFRGAPIVSEAQLRSPYVHLVRTGANRYNFSDLMEKKGPPKKADEKPARFSLNNITISGGAVDFIDQGLPVEKRHQVRGLELAVPFVSTIPHYADRYIDPRFRAVVNGSPLAFDGKLKPFARAAEYSLTLSLKDLDLPYYLAYVPGKLPVRVEAGRGATELAVTWRTSAERNPELFASGKVALSGLRVAEPAGAPLASLGRLDVAITRAELLAREFSLASVLLDAPALNISRDGAGRWNLQKLAAGEVKGERKDPPPAPKDEDKGKEKGRVAVDVAKVTLANGRLTVADALPRGGFRTEVKEIALDVTGFSTRPGKRADYTLGLATARGETAKLAGGFAMEPLAATCQAELGGIPLDAYSPYLAGVLTAPVKGSLALSAALDYADKALTADKVSVRLRDLFVPFGPREGARLARLDLEGGRYSQKENRAELAAVTLAGGDVRFSRDGEGKLSPLVLLRSAGTAPKPAAAPPPKAGAPPLRYRIGAVSGSGLAVAFTDRKMVGNPSFSLRRIAFDLKNLAGPKPEPIPYRLSAAYGTGGFLGGSGTLTPAPLAVKGDVTLRRIPLTDFDAYIPPGVNVILADGALDTRVNYALAKRGERLGGTFTGSLGVRSFHCLDADGDDLLTWESLQFDKVAGGIEPFSLRIGEVSLAKFYSKIVIDRDGRLNLQKLHTPENGDRGSGTGERSTAQSPPPVPAAPSVPAAQTVQAPPAPPTPAPRRIAIDTVVFQDGTLNFTDRHLKSDYATTLYNVGGRVSGLSSEESRFADVDLRGNLENLSPLQITGKINPLRESLYADIKVSFADIELSPFTPYSGTYVGYAVSRGKVSFDLIYKIENRRLDSQNKVFVDQLTFGDRVESDKATNLPVRLAVALLKDRKGEIHLDLPVAGQTDDPEFSVWRVVWQIIKNLLAKAATSPFALLEAAFGGREDFSAVRFAPGSAALAQPEQEKLAKLAQAIGERPSLKVDIKGYADRERDPEGYRVELLLRKMKGEKFLELVKEKRNRPGDTAEAVAIEPAEQSRLLKAVYRKEKFPKPRNILGLVKDLPDDEMRKLILANTAAGEQELRGLANERAAAVKAFLVERGKVEPARLFLKAEDIFKAPARDGAPASRVEFGAAVD